MKCLNLLAALLLFLPIAAQAQAALPTVKPATTCTALLDVDLTSIGGAGSAVTEATETTSDGIRVCQVMATLSPEITMQLLLPTETWSQRYLQVGCGGLCGMITLRSGASNGCQVLTDGGFAMAATDMGHSGGMGNDGSWGTDAQKRQDFAYRAQHLTAEASKALIETYYGQPQAYAYFNGCSDGGREALMEAQRYPEDFDGVIAGAPAMLFQVQNTLYHGWQAVSNTAEDGSIILLADRLPILHDAVIAACDANDGAVDGLIAEPAACNFDISTITCTGDDTTACLTTAEAEVARKFYSGPVDAETGAALTAGQPLYGSELNWAGVYVANAADGSLMSTNAALPAIRYLSFEGTDADETLADFSFTEETLDALRTRHTLFDATNPDLSGFDAAGGKLIMWHGLADPHISPANTVALHNSMIKTMGQGAVDGFERLYLLPGVAHCGNGEGPSNLDLLSAMIAWVEQGHAPDQIMTSTSSETSSFGQPDFAGDASASRGRPQSVAPVAEMERPVYPYPYAARYDGVGDVFAASSWGKGPAAEIVRTRDWPGADLFDPYTFTDN